MAVPSSSHLQGPSRSRVIFSEEGKYTKVAAREIRDQYRKMIQLAVDEYLAPQSPPKFHQNLEQAYLALLHRQIARTECCTTKILGFYNAVSPTFTAHEKAFAVGRSIFDTVDDINWLIKHLEATPKLLKSINQGIYAILVVPSNGPPVIYAGRVGGRVEGEVLNPSDSENLGQMEGLQVIHEILATTRGIQPCYGEVEGIVLHQLRHDREAAPRLSHEEGGELGAVV